MITSSDYRATSDASEWICVNFGSTRAAACPLCAPTYIKQNIFQGHHWATYVANVATRAAKMRLLITKAAILSANASS